ncbi:hypothetical protein OE88DRAFT_1248972 [Heliocybe sulcata]|uniref:Uncharacterized protein n=1 Tax=Heliocybe sulcata TaxID=5364 RepID=A0A5C3NIK4_9AGAM|nr:hypothetical protein OE88DRAFT_1248972 [Heliocybe sulcata]
MPSLQRLDIKDLTSSFFSGWDVLQGLTCPGANDLSAVPLPELRDLRLSFGGASFALPSNHDVERMLASRSRVVGDARLRSALETLDIRLLDSPMGRLWKKTKSEGVVRKVRPLNSRERSGRMV